MLPNNALLDLRRRQIDTLKIFNENVNEIKKNEEYSVEFVSSNRRFTLTVFLGGSFPNEKPRIQIKPLVTHKWIQESTGEVQNAPGLLNFTVHSDLGRVVHAIIREFEKFPPPLRGSEQIPHQQTPLNESTKQKVDSKVQMNIPELNGLTIDDLKRLNDNPDHLNDFVEEMQIVQKLNGELDVLIADIETIATGNLTKENQMQQLRSNVETNLRDFQQLGEKWEALCQRFQTKSDEFAPQHIKELLQIAASTADMVCDTHVEQLLNGTIDVQAFLDRYLQAKKLSAMRKAKEERLAHQLNELEKATF